MYKWILVILFVVFQIAAFSQSGVYDASPDPAREGAPEFLYKYNPHTNLPDYSLNTEYIREMLKILSSGFGIVPFEYDGLDEAVVAIDTSVLFPIIRSMISGDSIYFQLGTTQSPTGWYGGIRDTFYLDTTGGSGGYCANPDNYHVFYATAGQTTFDCTPYFNLTDNYKVYVNGSYQPFDHTRSGNRVIFGTGKETSTEVMIMAGYSCEEDYHHTFYAAAGQTTFDVGAYFNLSDNYKVWVEGSFQPFNHARSGNTVIFNNGFDENTEITISL